MVLAKSHMLLVLVAPQGGRCPALPCTTFREPAATAGGSLRPAVPAPRPDAGGSVPRGRLESGCGVSGTVSVDSEQLVSASDSEPLLTDIAASEVRLGSMLTRRRSRQPRVSNLLF